MQQAAEDMKRSHTAGHNKQDRSDLNRSRRSGGWGLNVTERKSRSLEVSVQRMDRPTRSFINLQATAKSAYLAHILTTSKPFMGLTKPRQTQTTATHSNIPLPPISGSRSISGKVVRTAAPPIHRKESAKPKGYNTHVATGNVMKNTVFHMIVTQCGKANQESKKYNQISVALAGGDKAAVQDSETTSRLIKQTCDAQPDASLTPASVDPLVQQKKNDASDPGANDSSIMMPVRVKHDARLREARQQRDFCSDDSAIETESGGSEDKGRPERLEDDSDDEYYTDQRITEWVLKVNSSLFSTGHDEMKSSEPAEEQDVATIKIIYAGD